MAKYKERTELAHKFGSELQVARIDEFITDNNQDITVVKTMGQPCIVTKDLSQLAAKINGAIRFFELERTQDYAKLTAVGTHKIVGIPMYWMGNVENGVFTIKPKMLYFSEEQAFADMYDKLTQRTEFVTQSYARSVLNRQDLIKTSLYLDGVGQYKDAYSAFTKIMAQQKQK